MSKFPIHPGSISYYELINGEEILQNKRSSHDIPKSMLFKEINAKWIPVVKVVMIQNEKMREIHEYGPNGQLLQSTLQLQDD
ncbi:hypothetical protein NEF87_003059 [Candidatus Lokiarchaeum ossiferum]|uniref:Uncharacterized protein n=1 Tax=Candidatus Lokiarchaeum ossiferum TaxID=2951803 RepID=A0ABY6HW36_9ARCH|nr:hypothetical protein NEF87_003059 [Candidatus Lokiarchaeum sp. B-35]